MYSLSLHLPKNNEKINNNYTIDFWGIPVFLKKVHIFKIDMS